MLARSAGFCFGVDRAVSLVHRLLEEGTAPVCTLGPIIHNPQIVRELTDKGVRIVHSPKEVPPGATLVIRSHGVPESMLREIEALGIPVVDATCPFVGKIHKIVHDYSEKGAAVLIAGDAGHPEVQGIAGFSRTETRIFGSLAELEKITCESPVLPGHFCIAVAQTTFNADVWKNCVRFLKKVYTNAQIFDTICDATSIRQQEARKIARNADRMIIIGGRQSSNTAKLYAVCSELCPSFLIEDAGELTPEMFPTPSASARVGVTAGASTPARLIKEVLDKMSEIQDSNVENGELGESSESTENGELSFAEALEQSFKTINTGDKVRGVVVGVSSNEVQIDVGTKHAGYIPASELSDDPSVNPEDMLKVGDEIDVIVMHINDADGTVQLSKKRVDAQKGWDKIVAASEDGSILEGTVREVINGGVLASANNVRVFIPASQSGVPRSGNLETLLHKTVQFKIIDLNPQRKRAVGSIRAVLREQRKAEEEKFWDEVEVGKHYTGTVKSLTSYGAFVDLGGVDGMVHVSELSWTRVKNPSEVVKVGDVIDVVVKDYNPETKKVSLTYRKQEDNPWNKFLEQFSIGDVVDAKIVSFMPFGAFAQIIPGVDGLIHISQISDQHIAKPQDALTMGQEVKVKITNVEEDRKRISLSMKAAAEDLRLNGEEQPADDETVAPEEDPSENA